MCTQVCAIDVKNINVSDVTEDNTESPIWRDFIHEKNKKIIKLKIV